MNKLSRHSLCDVKQWNVSSFGGLITCNGDPNLKLTVREALNAGYRYFKCPKDSDLQRVGEALASAMEEGVVKREDLRVAGELNYPVPADVEAHIRAALSSLQLGYFDIYTIRLPANDTFTSLMRSVVEKGLVRSIGVSNASPEKIGKLQIFPVVCEVEMHPFFRQTELLGYCRDKKIHCIACAPFAAGETTEPYCHERLSADYNLLKLEPVLAVAVALNKTPAQVLVRWAIQRGTSVLLPTVNHDRLRENIDVFDWELSVENLARLRCASLRSN